jgi:methylated-DNA-[protein]-cysteine S-methyltransferase
MTAETVTVHTTIDSPVDELLLVGEQSGCGAVALASLSMRGQRTAPTVAADWREAPELFSDIREQLDAYFAGERTRCDIECTSRGTDFQRRVWAAVDEIPFGTSTTYGALAAELGLARDRVQALGAAIGANPLLLVRPCHRVIGADGTMRGYAGGVERKVALLTHEGALPPALLAPEAMAASR